MTSKRTVSLAVEIRHKSKSHPELVEGFVVSPRRELGRMLSRTDGFCGPVDHSKSPFDQAPRLTRGAPQDDFSLDVNQPFQISTVNRPRHRQGYATPKCIDMLYYMVDSRNLCWEPGISERTYGHESGRLIRASARLGKVTKTALPGKRRR